MGTNEIYIALVWISWRLEGRTRKYSQEYLDRMAIKKLEEIAATEMLTEDVKEIAQSYLRQVKGTHGSGKADDACNALCKRILHLSDEKDFQAILIANPRKIKDWSDIWNKIRAGKIRRI